METSATRKMVTLKSNDGEEFMVPEAVAMQSQVIRPLIEADCTKDPIPLPNVSAKTLVKVFEYCKHQINAAEASKTFNMLASSEQSNWDVEMGVGNWNDTHRSKLSDWEEQFFNVNQDIVIDLVMAADYLHIDNLLGSACRKVADMMRGKTVEEIRKTFDIKNDLTPEEEQEIPLEYPWAFE